MIPFLVHADGAIHPVIENQDDRCSPVEHRGRDLLTGHAETAVADTADHHAIRVGDLGANCGRDRISHGAAGRPKQETAAAKTQKPLRPATEVARVDGHHGIIGQEVIEVCHHPPKIQRTAIDRRRSPTLVARARLFGRRLPSAAVDRIQVLGGGGELVHRRVNGEGSFEDPSQFPGPGMDMNQRVARLRDVEQGVALRGDLAQARPDDDRHVRRLETFDQRRTGADSHFADKTRAGVIEDVVTAERAANRQTVGFGKSLDVAPGLFAPAAAAD